MRLKTTGIAGTMESSDIMITLEPLPAGGGIHINLNSTVQKQFGRAIRRVITQALEDLGVADAQVTAVDKGALDCAIRARVNAAVARASGEPVRPWQRDGGREKVLG